MSHTPTCIKQTEDAIKRHQAWVKRWPNYCKKCDGVGILAQCDWVPYGSGVTAMASYELCECLCDDCCPRCGEAMGTEDDWDGSDPVTCPHCGWNSMEPDACPELPGPCTCEACEMYEQTYQELSEILKEND